jgi:type II secretory pathway component PulM
LLESPHFVAFFRLLTYAEVLSEAPLMSQQPMSNRILAGTVTFIGLGIVWIAIVNNLPSQQELSAKESPQSAAQMSPARPAAEPVLDLSIPGVPAAPPPADTSASATMPVSPSKAALGPGAAQVARLRCEAEMEQLCPAATDGLGRRQCLEKHAQRLPVPCQQQVRERLVKWKEERSRITMACQADIRRFCGEVGPEARQLQCLQEHVQELSDGCYQTLPKGALYFKQ